MQEIHGTATARVEATSEAVFGLITDIDRLPEWNDAIENVVERPADLTTGAEWVVKMHPSRMMSWKSRSCVEELDRDALRFAYRTVNEDGNPSYAVWRWEVVPLDSAAKVTVSWDVYLKTLDRKLLAGPIRRRQLRKEVAASLVEMEKAARSA
jgi:uncharacterized protein YndB with AHSA1/START domain